MPSTAVSVFFITVLFHSALIIHYFHCLPIIQSSLSSVTCIIKSYPHCSVLVREAFSFVKENILNFTSSNKDYCVSTHPWVVNKTVKNPYSMQRFILASYCHLTINLVQFPSKLISITTSTHKKYIKFSINVQN